MISQGRPCKNYDFDGVTRIETCLTTVKDKGLATSSCCGMLRPNMEQEKNKGRITLQTLLLYHWRNESHLNSKQPRVQGDWRVRGRLVFADHWFNKAELENQRHEKNLRQAEIKPLFTSWVWETGRNNYLRSICSRAVRLHCLTPIVFAVLRNYGPYPLKFEMADGWG